MSDTKPTDLQHSRELADKSRMTDDALLETHTRTFAKAEGNGQGSAVIPFITTAVLTLIFVFGGIYLNKYSAHYDPMIFNPEGRPAVFSDVSGGEVFEVKIDGKKLYLRNCIACHQADGMGLPGAFPPLVGSQWVRGEPDRMVAIMLNGLSGSIEVAGNTYNSIMTPFSAMLDDAQVAAIATFVRTNPDWGNNADSVSTEKAAEIRAAHERTKIWQADEILELFPLSE